MIGLERAFAWAVTIGLTVWLLLPSATARLTAGDETVFFGLAAVGLVAAVCYGFAHGGIGGAILLASSPLVGALGTVSLVEVLAEDVPAILVGNIPVWNLAGAVVGGIILGGLGGLIGWGVQRLAVSESTEPGNDSNASAP